MNIGEPRPARRIHLLHGPGVDERFLARRHIGGSKAGSFAVIELVKEGFESGDGAANDETSELGTVYVENGER